MRILTKIENVFFWHHFYPQSPLTKLEAKVGGFIDSLTIFQTFYCKISFIFKFYTRKRSSMVILKKIEKFLFLGQFYPKTPKLGPKNPYFDNF